MFARRAARTTLNTYAVLLVVLVGGGLLAGALLPGMRQLSSSSAGKPTLIAAPVYRFTPGTRLTYKVGYANTAHSDVSVLFGDVKDAKENAAASTTGLVNDFKADVRGEMVTTVLEQNAEGWLLACHWQNMTLDIAINGRTSATELAQAKNSLREEHFVQINPRGRVLWVRFAPSTGEIAQGIARTLLANAQFVLPEPGGSGETWEAQEDDPNGTSVARYQRGNTDKDTTSYTKSRLRYVIQPEKRSPGDINVPVVITPEDRRTAKFDTAAGHLIALEGTEKQTTTISNKNTAQSKTDFTLAFVRQEEVAPTDLNALKAQHNERVPVVKSVPLSVQASLAEREASVQKKELGDATTESILEALDAADRDKSGGEDPSALYLKVKALAAVRPEASAALAKKLLTAAPRSNTMRIVTAALGAVNNTEAQNALVTAIRARRSDWAALSQLLPPLGGAPEPTPQAEEILHDLAVNATDVNIASTAQLVLGSIAFNLRETNPERAGKIVEEAAARLDAAATVPLKQRYLLTLGNAGSARGLPALSKYIADANPAIRAVSVYALRFIPDASVNEKLLTALTGDAEPRVRQQAAVALRFREMTAPLFAAQKQAYQQEKEPGIRLVLLQNLWKARQTFPEARQLVVDAQKDTNEDLRKAAQSMLEERE